MKSNVFDIFKYLALLHWLCRSDKYTESKEWMVCNHFPKFGHKCYILVSLHKIYHSRANEMTLVTLKCSLANRGYIHKLETSVYFTETVPWQNDCWCKTNVDIVNLASMFIRMEKMRIPSLACNHASNIHTASDNIRVPHLAQFLLANWRSFSAEQRTYIGMLWLSPTDDIKIYTKCSYGNLIVLIYLQKLLVHCHYLHICRLCNDI